MSPQIEIEKYPYSAAKAFLDSLSLSDVHVRTRNVQRLKILQAWLPLLVNGRNASVSDMKKTGL